MTEKSVSGEGLNASGPPAVAGWRLLGTRDIGLLWSGQLIAQIGDGISKVALLWFVYALTGSALKMTMVGLLQTIPPLLLGPLIGVYVDRLPKKSVMIGVDLIRGLLVVLIPILHGMGELTLGRLYLLVFLISLVSTAFGPALASTVPLIVSPGQRLAANAVIQSSANIGVLLGPALSGLGIQFIGEQQVLYLNAVAYLVSALCMVPMRVPHVVAPAHAFFSKTVVDDVVLGFRYVFLQERVVLLLMVTIAFYNVAWSGFLFLLPVVAQQVLDIGPLQLGWLWSALGLGMLMTSAWLASREQGDLSSQLRWISISMAIGGLAVCGLKMFGNLMVATPLVIIIGGCIALVTPVVWALLQEMIPKHLSSRVFATFSTGGMAAAMAGMLTFGWAADTVGSGTSLLGIGVLLLGAAVVAAHFGRLLRLPRVVVPMP